MYSLNQLKEIADERVKALVEGGTLENAKPIYWHTCHFYKNVTTDYIYDLFFIILNNSSTSLTRDDIFNLIRTSGFYAVAINSKCSSLGENGTYDLEVVSVANNDNPAKMTLFYRRSSDGITQSDTTNYNFANSVFEDLGANKIN